MNKRSDQETPSSNRWCFIPAQPFKKPVMLNRSQPDLFRHVMTTASDVTTMVKRVASGHHGK